MSSRPGRNGKALSLLIVWSLAVGGVFTVLLALSPPASAAPCDAVSGVITGDWTISTVQVCEDIVYTVDGTITINAGGSLTLVNGGLRFAKDASHASYSLNVNSNGALILDNSILTTERVAITPDLKLAFTLTGPTARFSMRNGAVLKFPGWFNATSGTINVTDSSITGFTDQSHMHRHFRRLLGTTPGTIARPVVDTRARSRTSGAGGASTVVSYRSRVERLFEWVSGGNFTGNGNLSLTGGSRLYAYDSYLGVDFSDDPARHNTLQVDGTSNAYLYNVTIDRSQDPPSMATWMPAYLPTAAGGSIYLLRWFHATVLDSTDFPVSSATIASYFSPSGALATYPDNGGLTTPSAQTLWYIGRAASGTNAWNRADATGRTKIPLTTDQITTTSLPNAESFGNYEAIASFDTSTTSAGVYFPAYPAIDEADNNVQVTLAFDTLQVRTNPDLEIRQSEYTATITVTVNQPFTVYARVYNNGQTTATNVAVAVFLDGTTEVARVTGLTIPAFVNQSISVPGITAAGSHTLMLEADPDNTIDEGGAAQESNNFASITVNVLPPPTGFVAIDRPLTGQTVEPGAILSITGYVRDAAGNGIVGVTLTIEIRSGTDVVGTPNVTVSEAQGFFRGEILVPASTPDGAYSLVVTPGPAAITGETRTISIIKGGPFLFQPVPLLGIPWWFLLLILGIIAAIAVGLSLYLKFYGLGKMVECGECGAFIPEDATTCPKCGVEFEKDMAKCSNCNAWIPVDLKECPECGVQFATGQVEMADYQEKMRLQYDEVVQKFKAEASRQLGRTLSDREFQEWWRKQPTFVTFEDWLREEEEMRKMGSKPCPVCGTLNSVTAAVCHKCGSLMREGPKPPQVGATTGAVVAGAPRKPAPPPPTGAPVVQKKVIRRPVEGEQAEAAEAQESSTEEGPPKDDL